MDTARVRRSLLRWFARAKRPLPWRRTRDPYAIWVSEMMLQQTTVATVIPYYERFMKRFPTVVILAAADEDAVLSLWSGLGYYSRARNLRLAARDVVDNHAGVFPRDVETAMRLRGGGSDRPVFAPRPPFGLADALLVAVAAALAAGLLLVDRGWARG